MKEKESTLESGYVREHLANERTFLAWVRTALAVIGIGLLIVSLHFTVQIEFSPFEDVIVLIVGFASILLGGFLTVFATMAYFDKRKRINNQTFRSSQSLILLLMIVLLILTPVYFFLIVD
jgi:putative membrane protein